MALYYLISSNILTVLCYVIPEENSLNILQFLQGNNAVHNTLLSFGKTFPIFFINALP